MEKGWLIVNSKSHSKSCVVSWLRTGQNSYSLFSSLQLHVVLFTPGPAGVNWEDEHLLHLWVNWLEYKSGLMCRRGNCKTWIYNCALNNVCCCFMLQLFRGWRVCSSPGCLPETTSVTLSCERHVINTSMFVFLRVSQTKWRNRLHFILQKMAVCSLPHLLATNTYLPKSLSVFLSMFRCCLTKV